MRHLVRVFALMAVGAALLVATWSMASPPGDRELSTRTGGLRFVTPPPSGGPGAPDRYVFPKEWVQP